jgi:hypothetical protein
MYMRYRRQKATADAYAASKLQQQVFLAWSQEAGQARSKATAAVNMAARVQARVHNQLTYECFAAWREQAQRASAVKVGTDRWRLFKTLTYSVIGIPDTRQGLKGPRKCGVSSC